MADAANPLPIVDTEAYIARFLDARRPGADKVHAYYDHRLGAICKDPRLMLIPLDDHLVHRGDGVFETMKWVEGKLYQLDPHIRRMQRSCKAIFLSPPCPWEQVRQAVVEVARAAGTEAGLIRALIGRGPGGFGIDPVECPVPSLHIVAYRFTPKPEKKFEQGATSFRTSIPAKQSYLATIKSIDYLPNVLMRREALEKGFDFPICFDAHGFLAEGATENICIVDQSGCIVVPEFTNCLAGTTLTRGLDLIAEEREVVFKKIAEPEIYDAQEMVVVGTTADALAIVRYNGKPIHDARPGPVAKRLRELLQQDLRDNGVPVHEA